MSCSDSGLKGSSGASRTLQGRAAPWTLGSCREGGGPGPAHRPAVTFSTQQVPVHVTHPEQGEASGEVEDTLPAVPVQQQGAHGPSYQRPGGQGRAWPWPWLHPTAQEMAENAHPAAAWRGRGGRAWGRWACEEPRAGRGSGTDTGAPVWLLTSCFQTFKLCCHLPCPFSSLIREDKLPNRALSVATAAPEPTVSDDPSQRPQPPCRATPPTCPAAALAPAPPEAPATGEGASLPRCWGSLLPGGGASTWAAGWFSLSLPRPPAPGPFISRFTHLNQWFTGRLYFAC